MFFVFSVWVCLVLVPLPVNPSAASTHLLDLWAHSRDREPMKNSVCYVLSIGFLFSPSLSLAIVVVVVVVWARWGSGCINVSGSVFPVAGFIIMWTSSRPSSVQCDPEGKRTAHLSKIAHLNHSRAFSLPFPRFQSQSLSLSPSLSLSIPHAPLQVSLISQLIADL